MMKIDKTANSKMPFIQVPKVLVENERYRHVSVAAILLYALLLDRYKIAIRNSNAWRNNQGQVYICYTIADTQRHIRCGHDKACGLFRELQNAGLIERTRKGLGQESQIVVFLPTEHSEKAEVLNTELQSLQISNNRVFRIDGLEKNIIKERDNSYLNNLNTHANDTEYPQNDSTSLQSQDTTCDYESIFGEIYDHYPAYRRGIRAKDYAVFQKTITTYEDAQLALDNYKLWCNSTNWKNEGGKYIPLLKNYLIRGYWKQKPPNCTSTNWGSGELGDAELLAIQRLFNHSQE